MTPNIINTEISGFFSVYGAYENIIRKKKSACLNSYC